MTANTTQFLATAASAIFGLCAVMNAALAQEQDDATSTFTRIQGGAVYDLKYGVDGSAVSEEYMLTHIVCTDGSKQLRIMLPVSPEDDGTIYSSGGAKSTLKKVGKTYQVTFEAGGQRIRKTMELKSVNDPKSHYERQFVVKVNYADSLWTSFTSSTSDGATMLIGEGGQIVGFPVDQKLRAALTSCGLTG